MPPWTTATTSVRSCCGPAPLRGEIGCTRPPRRRSSRWAVEAFVLEHGPLGPAHGAADRYGEAHGAGGPVEREEPRLVSAGRPAHAVGPLHGHLAYATGKQLPRERVVVDLELEGQSAAREGQGPGVLGSADRG